MQNRSNVLIVGGGIWGLSTAWHLAKRGVSEICVVERNTEVALETTPRAATSFAPDGRYLIGPIPIVDGLFVASDCAALGIAGSAAVSSWLAESVVTGKTASALTEFDPLRFGARATDRAWVTQASCEYYANCDGLCLRELEVNGNRDYQSRTNLS